MIHDGRVKGLPLVDYLETKGNIEALSNVEEGMTAYASDDNEFGSYNGAAWQWDSRFALLAGRSGGQTLYGGTDAGDDLTLLSTSHGTKGTVAIGGTLCVDEVNNKVGIGTAAPGELLTIEGTLPKVLIEDTGSTSAAIQLKNTEGWFSLYTDADTFGIYDVTDTTTRLTIDGDGRTGIGIGAALGAMLHVDNVGTIAQPVAYFDQGDASEEMFEFATTIGVGNAIEAVGGKTLTTTHFIKVTLPGALTRYIPVGTIA